MQFLTTTSVVAQLVTTEDHPKLLVTRFWADAETGHVHMAISTCDSHGPRTHEETLSYEGFQAWWAHAMSTGFDEVTPVELDQLTDEYFALAVRA